jgi:hypothetical protein
MPGERAILERCSKNRDLVRRLRGRSDHIATDLGALFRTFTAVYDKKLISLNKKNDMVIDERIMAFARKLDPGATCWSTE